MSLIKVAHMAQDAPEQLEAAFYRFCKRVIKRSFIFVSRKVYTGLHND